MISWIYLGVAVLFEILVAFAAGNAKGFTKPGWTATTLISGAIATFFLSLALLEFDVGVGYSIWTSAAGVGIVIIGTVFFKERFSGKKTLRNSACHCRCYRPSS